jgi:hypothetical protein
MISFKGVLYLQHVDHVVLALFLTQKRHKRITNIHKEENGLRSSLLIEIEACSQVSSWRVKESLFILFHSRDTVWIVR